MSFYLRTARNGNPTVTIWVSETDNNTMTTSWLSRPATPSANLTLNCTSEGWVTIDIADYEYTGRNLLVSIYEERTATCDDLWGTSPTDGNLLGYNYNNSAFTGIATNVAERPRIRLTTTPSGSYSMPICFDFEDWTGSVTTSTGSLNNTGLPSGWTGIYSGSVTNGAAQIFNNSSWGGSNGIFMSDKYNACNYLVVPEISGLSSGDTLSFDHRSQCGSDVELTVGYTTDPVGLSDFTPIQNVTPVRYYDASWNYVHGSDTIILPATFQDGAYIVFKWCSTTYNTCGVFLDNICFSHSCTTRTYCNFTEHTLEFTENGNYSGQTVNTYGDGDVEYSSNNTSVVAVNPTTGALEVRGPGIAYITANVTGSSTYCDTRASYRVIVHCGDTPGTITYHTGTNCTGTVTPSDWTETASSTAITYETPQCTPATPSPCRFVEWNTAANGSGTTYMPGQYIDLSCGNMELYAIYKYTKDTLTGSQTPCEAMAFCTSSEQNNGVVLEAVTNVAVPSGMCSYFHDASWWYIEVEEGGNLEITISGTRTGGGNLDVDFACWGPFDEFTCAQADLSNASTADFYFDTRNAPGPWHPEWYGDGHTSEADYHSGAILNAQWQSNPNSASNNGDGNVCMLGELAHPSGNLVDFGGSVAGTEYLQIPNAEAGKVYMIVVANYSNDPGYINFEQTNYGQSGSAVLKCKNVSDCIVNAITINTSACNTTDNTYTVDGLIYLTSNQPIPDDGVLTIEDPVTGSQAVFFAPFTSPISYTLTGLNSDGAAHNLVAVFTSNDINCTKNQDYTAPDACLTCSAEFTTTPSCNNIDNGTATITVTSGTAPYQYSSDGGTTWTSPATDATSHTFENLPAGGTYTLQVRDGNGCVSEETVTVPASDLSTTSLVVTPTSSAICSDGNVILHTGTTTPTGGTPSYTYTWRAEGGVVTPRAATSEVACARGVASSGSSEITFWLIVTDANGCKDSTSTVVSVYPVPFVDAEAENACLGQPVTLLLTEVSGGTTPYVDTIWYIGSTQTHHVDHISITPTEADVYYYSVQVRDSRNCRFTRNIEVEVYDIPSVGAVSYNQPSCYGGDDGSITVTVVSPDPMVDVVEILLDNRDDYTQSGDEYTWTGLRAGNHTLYLRDNRSPENCDNTIPLNLTQPDSIEVSATATATACAGDPVNLEVTDVRGGSGTFTSYTWTAVTPGNADPTTTGDPSGITATATPSTSGDVVYRVVVTDDNGCKDSTEVTVSVSAKPEVSIASIEDQCPNAENVEITAALTTGTDPDYTYTWTAESGITLTSPTSHTREQTKDTIYANMPNTCDGTYTITLYVADDNGCKDTATTTVRVTDNTPPVPNVTEIYADAVACLSAAEVSATDMAGLAAQGFTFTDGCSYVTLKSTDRTFKHSGNSCLDTLVITYTVEDACHREVTVTLYQRIYDSLAPAAEHDTIVAASAQCLSDSIKVQTNVANLISLGYGITDNCTKNAFSIESVTRTVKHNDMCNDSIIIKYTIADSCGNTKDVWHVQKIQDDTPPTATQTIITATDKQCIGDSITVLDNFAAVNALGYGIEDNCTKVNFTLEGVTRTVKHNDRCNDSIIIKYTIADSCGNTKDVWHVQRIKDDTPPTATQTIITAADKQCISDSITVLDNFAAVNALGYGIEDNCTKVNFTLEGVTRTVKHNAMCNDSIIIKYTIADSCGNTKDVWHVQRIKDDTPPTAEHDIIIAEAKQCISDSITVLGSFATVNALGYGITDNCTKNAFTIEGVTRTVKHNDRCNDSIIIKYTIADSCGNTKDVWHVQLIKDDTPPTATQTIITAADKQCIGDSITVLDNFAAVNALGYGIEDNCTKVNFTIEGVTRTVKHNDMCNDSIIIKYTIADSCGNTKDVWHVQRIKDDTPPTATQTIITAADKQCISDSITVLDNFAAVNAIGYGIEDNCTKVNFTLEGVTRTVKHNDICNDSIIIKYTIADSCGNTKDVWHVQRIKDDTPPTATQTIITAADKQCISDSITVLDNFAAVNALGYGIEDNCTKVNFTIEGVTRTVKHNDMCNDSIIIKYTIADSCGNTKDVWHVQQIKDDTPPTSAHDTVVADAKQCLGDSITVLDNFAAVNVLGYGIEDNCTKVNFTLEGVTRTVKHNDICNDSIIIKYTIADSCGNTKDVWHVQKIQDTDAPVAHNAAMSHDTLWVTGTECLKDSITTLSTIADVVTLFDIDDNCTKVNFQLKSTSNVLKTGENCADTVVIKYVVADSCNNEATFYHAQPIQDVTPPTAEHDTIIASAGQCIETDSIQVRNDFATVNALGFGIEDNCTKVNFTLQGVERTVRHTDPCTDSVIIKYTVADSCGNTKNVWHIQQIKDEQAPTIKTPGTWPDDVTGQNVCVASSDLSVFLSESAAADLFEDCNTVTVTYTQDTTVNVCDWTVRRMYVIADACDNKTYDTIKVSGTNKVELAMSPDTTICLGGTANLRSTATVCSGDATYQWTSESANNGMPGTTNTNNISVMPTSPGVMTYTDTAYDANGCKTVESITVNVIDTASLSATNTIQASICVGGNIAPIAIEYSNATLDYEYNSVSGTLPPGLDITTHGNGKDTITGSITGATIGDIYTFSIIADNADNCGDKVITCTITITNGTKVYDTVTGCGSYTWTSAANPSEDETFDVTGPHDRIFGPYTSVSGCDSSFYLHVVIYDLPTPTMDNDTVCVGSDATLAVNQTYAHYDWGNGVDRRDSTVTTTDAGETTYIVTVTDEHNCSADANAKIVVKDTVSLRVINGEQTLCLGKEMDTVKIIHYHCSVDSLNVPAGLTLDLTFNDSTAIITGTPTATYKDTVYGNSHEENVTCDQKHSLITITVNEPSDAGLPATATLCASSSGTNNSVTITSSLSTDDYDFTWTATGATPSSATNVNSLTLSYDASGDYEVTVIAEDKITHCLAYDTTQVHVNAVTIPVIAGRSTICAGETDTLTTTVDYASYEWIGQGSTYDTLFVITSGDYTVVGTDANGCSDTSAVFHVDVLDAITITENSKDTTYCFGDTADSLSFTAHGGNGTYSYQWYVSTDGGTSYAEITGATDTVYTPATTAAGNYSYKVEVTGECGPVEQVIAVVGVRQPLAVTEAIADDALCLDATAGEIGATVTGGTGVYDFVWEVSTDSANYTTASTDSAYVPETTTAGTYYYRLTVTDSLCGDTTLHVQKLVVKPNVGLDLVGDLNQTKCIGGNIDSVRVVATNAASVDVTANHGITPTYNTTTGNIGFTTAGNENDVITVTVVAHHDENSCGDSMLTFTVTLSAQTVVNLTREGCESFHWQTNNEDRTFTVSKDTVIGPYTSTEGCDSITNLSVVIYDLPTPTMDNDTVCVGSEATLAVNQTYAHYDWGNGVDRRDSTVTTTDAGETTYTVTVTDEHNCSADVQAKIVVHDTLVPIFVADPNDTVCAGSAVTVSETSGNRTDYTYSIAYTAADGTDAVASDSTVTVTYTTAGTYYFDFTITNDTTNCVSHKRDTIVVLPKVGLELTGNLDQQVCVGSDIDSVMVTATNAASVDVSANQGITPTYNETTGNIGFTAAGNENDVITVTVVAHHDENSCDDSTLTFQVTLSALTTKNLTVSGCGSYHWVTANEDTLFTATTDTIIGPYPSANGCDSMTYLHVDVNGGEMPVFSLPEDVCVTASETNDSIEISVQALTGYTYVWDIDGGVRAASSPLASDGVSDTNVVVVRWADDGDKTVSVTLTSLENSCTGTDSKTIHVHAVPAISIAAVTGDICPYVGSQTLTATVDPATAADYTYTWGGGLTVTTDNTTTDATTSEATATIPTSPCDTTYNVGVSVTDGNGCTATADSVTLTVRDVTAPTYDKPNDTTIYKDATCNADITPEALGTVSNVVEGCSPDVDTSYTDVDVTPATACMGTTVIERRWRVVDLCGNVSTSDSVQTITILDTVAPIIEGTMAEVTVEGCDESAVPAVAATDTTIAYMLSQGVTSVTDYCSDEAHLTVSISDGAMTGDCDHEVIRTYTVTDDCGNSSSTTQTITITRPAFVVPAMDTTTVVCENDATAPTPAAVTLCGNEYTAQPVNTGDTNRVTETVAGYLYITYNYEYTDCKGSYAWHKTYKLTPGEFTPVDSVYDVVACPSDINSIPVPTVIVCGDTVPFTFTTANSSDTARCGDSIYNYTYTVNGTTYNWAYIVRFEPGDFTMPEDDSVVVHCPSAIVLPNTVAGRMPEVHNACGEDISDQYALASQPDELPTCEGRAVYTYSYTDCAGHSHEWHFTYILEREDFTIAAEPGSATVACAAEALGAGEAGSVVTLPTVMAMCDGEPPLMPIDTIEGQMPSCDGVMTYTYRFNDCTGNHQHDWVFTYTVRDSIAPTIAPIADRMADAGGGCEYVIPDLSNEVNATDNCGETHFMGQTPTAGTRYQQTEVQQQVEVIVQVDDDCQNHGYDTVIVTIPARNPHVTVNPTNPSICYGDTVTLTANGTSSATGEGSYRWNPINGLDASTGATVHAFPTTPMTYTVTYTDGNGCEASASAVVTVNPQSTLEAENLNQEVCVGGSITNIVIGYTNSTITISGLPNGLTYRPATATISGRPTESGTFTITATSNYGCPEKTLTGTITVDDTVTTTSDIVACDSYVWPVNNGTYATSGRYRQLITASDGCISAEYLNLTINHRSYGVDEVSACDEFTWTNGNGQTYTSSTSTPTYTIQNGNAVGCDSITTLHLTMHYSNNTETSESACDSYTWFGTTYTNSTDATFTTQNRWGCDSTVVLHLTVNPSYHFEPDNDSICAGESVSYHGNQYSSTGNYTVTLRTRAGCDSVYTLHLTVLQPQTVSIEKDENCLTGSYTLTAITESDAYRWSETPDRGQVEPQATQKSIEVAPPATTTYTVTVGYGDNLICPQSASITLDEFITPTAIITTRPAHLSFDHPEWFADDHSTGATGREWYVDGEVYWQQTQHINGAIEANPYDDNDSVTLTLIVYNDRCADTAEVVIPLIRSEIWVPNVFTPSLDINNLFGAEGVNIIEYEIWIYTREGLRVFHSDDMTVKWDGKHEGTDTDCKQDAYTWRIDYRFASKPEELQTKVGLVLLLR